MDVGTNAIMERLKASPAWQQAAAEAEAELVSQRKAAAGRIDAAEAEFAKQRPGLEKAVEKARAERDRLQKELDIAVTALQGATNALRAASAKVDGVRSREHAFLRSTAPERIEGFRRELEELWEAHRNRSVVTEGGGGYNRITGQPIPPESWNKPSLDAFMSTILAEIRRCGDELKLIVDPDELDAEIERIRSSLPDPNRMVKIGRAA